MNATLQNFCSRLASLGFSVFAQDKVPAKDGWITVHPNGPEHKGQHVEIDDETGGVKKGFGGKFKGQKISEIKSGFRGPQVNRLAERPDRKPEPSPMRTPAPQTSAGQKLGGRLQNVLQKRQQEMEKSQPAPKPSPTQPGSSKASIQKYIDKYQNKGLYDEDVSARRQEINKKLEDFYDGNIQLSDGEFKELLAEKYSIRYGKLNTLQEIEDVVEYEYKTANQTKERRKESAERKRNANPKSIDGVTRGKPMTLKAADGTSVNPRFSEGGDYRINCQSCTLAYEMRCRGYNIEARPRGDPAKGGSGALGDKLCNYCYSAYIDVDTGRHPIIHGVPCKNTRKKSECKKMLDSIDRIIQPGERYAFWCGWKGCDYGHIFNMAKSEKGTLYLIDSQQGIFLKGKSAAFEGYFAKHAEMEHTRIFRTDNTQLNTEFEGVMKKVG